MTLPISDRSKRRFAFLALPYAAVTGFTVFYLGPYHPVSFSAVSSYFVAYILIIGAPLLKRQGTPRKPRQCHDPDCFMCERRGRKKRGEWFRNMAMLWVYLSVCALCVVPYAVMCCVWGRPDDGQEGGRP